MSERVLIAISGKVESLVAAWLLKKQGRQLRGVYLDILDREAARNKVLEYERKLGISIQVIRAQEMLIPVLKPFFENRLATGKRFNLKQVFHQKILMPEILKIKEQHQFIGLASGHRVLLQNDPANKQVKVCCYENPAQDEAHLIMGLSQDQIATIELPLGSIPYKMMERIAVELGLGEFDELFRIDWKGLESELLAYFTQDMNKTIDVFGADGGRLGTCTDFTRYCQGDQYQVPDSPVVPDQNMVITEINAKLNQMKIADLNKRNVYELELEDAAWFTRADLGLKVLNTTMIWEPGQKPTPVKLIQFEESRIKAIIEEPLQGPRANIFSGDSVLWISGNEVLGGARVSRVK